MTVGAPTARRWKYLLPCDHNERCAPLPPTSAKGPGRSSDSIVHPLPAGRVPCAVLREKKIGPQPFKKRHPKLTDDGAFNRLGLTAVVVVVALAVVFRGGCNGTAERRAWQNGARFEKRRTQRLNGAVVGYVPGQTDKRARTQQSTTEGKREHEEEEEEEEEEGETANGSRYAS